MEKSAVERFAEDTLVWKLKVRSTEVYVERLAQVLDQLTDDERSALDFYFAAIVDAIRHFNRKANEVLNRIEPHTDEELKKELQL